MNHGPSAGWRVLVTGASSGLGRCLALELAHRGCSLVLTGRDRNRLEAVAEEVRRIGVDALVILADLSQPSGATGLAEAVATLEPPVDALVNNAGATRAGSWSEHTEQQDAAALQLLLASPLTLTRRLLPLWRSRGRGALFNVASSGVFQPGPQTSVYYAAKAFLFSWSVALAREERRWLAVTTLCPGALRTGFSQAAGKRDVPGAPGPEAVAATGVRAWCRGRGVIVPGLVNKLLVATSRLVPPAWSAAVVEKVQLSVKKL